MLGIQKTRRMFTRSAGDLLEDSGICCHFNILGKLLKIPGNVTKGCLYESQHGTGE